MSYNLHDLRDDRAAAARIVRAVAPDVLCVQEVPRRLTTELRVPRLARACGLVWHRRRLGTGGTAVLTAPGLTVHEVLRGRLPVRFPDRTRGYAAATVSLPGDGPRTSPVTVASIHLGLKPAERARHAAAVLERLGERAVVAGDLNEGPGGTAYAIVAERYPLASSGAPTFPARQPTAALDAVFAAAALRVLPTDPVPLDLRDLEAASDHRPVWVDLDVSAPAPGRPG
ncbi:endonuclease/exonuclease/phosphatase family protein [Terrabacter sp. NPDC080008]|uniref:endonuclease/exonuclease/phosphatase family protein n=1 Tax=Terrabacter sp. NPDC080008 TaxID=3155176 RepID=UPI003450CE3C